MNDPKKYGIGLLFSLAVLFNHYRVVDKLFCFCPERRCIRDPFTGRQLCISTCGCEFPNTVYDDGKPPPPRPTPCQNNATSSTTIVVPDKSVVDGSVAINSFAVTYQHDLEPIVPDVERFTEPQRITTEEGSVSISPPISDPAYYKVRVNIENSTDPATVTDKSFASIGTCGRLFNISLPISKP